MRTFQFSDAKSHKFWNIEVNGKSFTVTFGKVGTEGRSQTKKFPSAEKAQAEADKLIREKVKKGYVETTAPEVTSTAEALERELAEDPRDLEKARVYADYLVEQGDPRGEFMQVQIALEDESLPAAARKKLRAREQKLLKEHEKEWVGDWADLYQAPTDTEGDGQINHTGGRKYEFRRGLLAAVHFGELTVAAASAFVKAPQVGLVHELFLGGSAYEEGEEGQQPAPDLPPGLSPDDENLAAQILLRWPHLRNIRRFQFGWAADEEYGDWCHFQCHLNGELLEPFVKQMPDLEELLVFAHTRELEKLAALPMPRLRVLQLYHGWSYPLEKLAKNKTLTNLTHLLCHPHALEYGDEAYITLAKLKAVCRSPHLGSLTHLRLRLTSFGDEGAEEIVESGILKRLKVLDLRHGNITDEGARLLAECPDLRNLEHLDLSRNALTEDGIAALRATGVPVEVSHQHAHPDTQAEDEQEHLGQGDYE